ncbi:MAG: hypothetical protein U9N52_04890 [Campylobacterota bacterium]|nr:hypothetical protein [Campylobacterota bacterium]
MQISSNTIEKTQEKQTIDTILKEKGIIISRNIQRKEPVLKNQYSIKISVG